MRLIGISGKVGTGKTSTAITLAACCTTEARLFSFAFRLKAELAELLGTHPNVFDAYKNAHLTKEQSEKITSLLGMPYEDLTKRRAMQLWGDYRRGVNPDYWVELAMGDMHAFKKENPGGLAIFHDVRFPNEANALRSDGAILVRLQPWCGWVPGPNADHISETALDDYAFFDITFRPEKDGIDEVAEAIHLYAVSHPTSLEHVTG